jgi:non-specific serine/threonine protein kinase/serine/threonine-protein kinase
MPVAEQSMTHGSDRVESLFAAAAGLSPQDRGAYLERECADDLVLRERVDDLLRAHDRAEHLLDQPAVAVGGPTAGYVQATERPGTIVGPYKLLQLIGEGGFGAVYLAEQTEPVRRMVALKVLKPGMDTRQVVARFEAERQALALMDHPNIAKVLDADVTAEGRPYFVMELVKGRPITAYCDEHCLTPRQRLELFIPVCQAVQHAHQKGLIHRDLKPSNVLVGLYDGRPVPKVIDFGVAKALGQKLVDKTLFTEFGTVVGTLEYMSPEQAQLDNLDVDTRSDIYSLGVLLYELLTGTTPLDRRRLAEAGFMEVLRVIREEEPPKPSTRLSTSEALPSISAHRQTEPGKLTKLVRGDLDWIVMKALDKDRGRRYETANGLARDLERYLAEEVVEARSPSAGYRLRKFVKRNRRTVWAASIIFLMLVAGIVGTTVGLVEARKQRDAADTAEKLASNRLVQVESEKQRADEERDVAQAVNDFIQELLGQANLDAQPGGEGPRDPDIKVRTVLDRAAKTIGARFANKPRVEAAIRMTIAHAYFGLGSWPEARFHAERSVELRTATLGAANADTLTSKCFLALVLQFLGEVKRGESLMEEVMRQQTETLGPDHRDTLTSKRLLAHAYASRYPMEFDRAEVLLQEVIPKSIELLGPNHEETLVAKVNLAWVYRLQGKFDLAEAMYVELFDTYKTKYGPDRPNTLLIQTGLGLIYVAQERFDEAERHLRNVLERRIVLQGENNPYTISSRCVLARLYLRWQKYDQAAQLYEQAFSKLKEQDGYNDDTLLILSELAQTRLQARQPDKALPLVAEFIKAAHEHPRRESMLLELELADIGRLLVRNEQYVEAEKHLRESLAIYEKKDRNEWSTFDTRSRLGAALMGQKKYAEAEPHLREGYEGMQQRVDRIPVVDRSRLLTEAIERLIQFYDATNKPAEAAKWRAELEAHRKAGEKPATPKEK